MPIDLGSVGLPRGGVTGVVCPGAVPERPGVVGVGVVGVVDVPVDDGGGAVGVVWAGVLPELPVEPVVE
jgi:hypothetical protein